MYKIGAIFTGFATAGFATAELVKQQNASNDKFFKVFTPLPDSKYNTCTYAKHLESLRIDLPRDTCAEKVLDTSIVTVIGTVSYPFVKISDTQSGHKALHYTGLAFVGTAFCGGLGVLGAFTWPVTLPLGCLYLAEKKMGWKLC